MEIDLITLSDIFIIPDEIYTIGQVNHGHINKTFRVIKDGNPVYILQLLNNDVFGNIDQLMDNYRLVTTALSSYQWLDNLKLKTPEIIPTRQNKLFYTDDLQRSWRLITYIEGTDFNLIPRNAKTSYQGGLAFGTFIKGVSGIDPVALHHVIPEFHSLEMRLGKFGKALESDPAGRISLAQDEIQFVLSRQKRMMQIPERMASGDVPLRVVHNDTKLSNVIFDESGNAVGVIDLDTVMAGSVLFDFGDAIRSSANTACEDEPDLSKVQFNIELFDAFSKGYLESTHSLLCKSETELLPESALLLTYIIGIRFLTDYLNGDKYYRTNYSEHNLIRARVQFRLLALMESETARMHQIISKNNPNICST